MKKADLAGKLARQTHRSRAAAADDVDQVVHEILTRLRQGEEARLPGLGTLKPGGAAVRFEQSAPPRGRE